MTMRAWGTAVALMGHTCIAPDRVSLKDPLFGGYSVDMHGAVAALSSYIFVEGVPRNTLNVVTVLRNFVNTFP